MASQPLLNSTALDCVGSQTKPVEEHNAELNIRNIPWAIDPRVWENPNTLRKDGMCQNLECESHTLVENGVSFTVPREYTTKELGAFGEYNSVPFVRIWFCSSFCLLDSFSAPKYLSPSELN